MITRAKIDSVHTRRIIAEDIHDKDLVKELFSEIVKKIGDRPGGYTRIVKLGHRRGDAAEMALLELVDFNDLVEKKKAAAKKKDENAVSETPKKKTAEPKIEDAVVVEETEGKKVK
jgi:large subunit ribosomal protein L17